uniref:Sugar phosphate transporter domain-containing protein n=1 Tax=Pinguiococcus pyrenoidosus TaxID=172671 RepID=A0A7R9UBX6_9STRA|mmetsp:Transcript_3200/g.12834  ORF Transcript_3200/g.12834 Transcript_3200/m.12834 type:complete len:355 (+) Transcript_3200:96-1160(+)
MSKAATPARGAQMQHTDNTEYGGAAVACWLLAWFTCNIGITLLNKSVFATVDFRYPCILSTVHMLCNTVGAHVLLRLTGQKQKPLDGRGWRTIVGISFLFAANIVVGNESLRYVSVTFNQVMASLIPVVVLGINVCQGRRFSFVKIVSIVPIVIGVVAATCGDMNYTSLGVFLTSLFVVLAALKSVASNLLLVGEYKLEAFDLLSRMAPLAFVWMALLSVATGEVQSLRANWNRFTHGPAIFVVLFSAFVSVALNVTSFMANKVTSALTLSIAGNVKQVLLIVISTLLFNSDVTLLNGSGIAVVIISSAQYSVVCTQEKHEVLEGSGKPSKSSGWLSLRLHRQQGKSVEEESIV